MMRVWNEFDVDQFERRDPAAVVFRLTGVLGESSEAWAFLERARQVVESRRVPVIVNMAGVSRLTSAGVGILASCYTAALGAGSHFALVGLSNKAKAILGIVRLLGLLRAYESEDEALENSMLPGHFAPAASE